MWSSSNKRNQRIVALRDRATAHSLISPVIARQQLPIGAHQQQGSPSAGQRALNQRLAGARLHLNNHDCPFLAPPGFKRTILRDPSGYPLRIKKAFLERKARLSRIKFLTTQTSLHFKEAKVKKIPVQIFLCNPRYHTIFLPYPKTASRS